MIFNDDPPVTIDNDQLPEALQDQIQETHSSETVDGMQINAGKFSCKCKLFEGEPCYSRFTAQQVVTCRMQMKEMTPGEPSIG